MMRPDFEHWQTLPNTLGMILKSVDRKGSLQALALVSGEPQQKNYQLLVLRGMSIVCRAADERTSP